MKKELIKEILILMIPLIIGISTFTTLFGVESLKIDSSIDLNIYDSYFVTQSYWILLISIITSITIFYTFRTIITRFKNLFSNLILIISLGLMIFIMTKLISFSNSILMDLENEYNTDSMKTFIDFMRYIQIGFIVILGIVGIRIGIKKHNA